MADPKNINSGAKEKYSKSYNSKPIMDYGRPEYAPKADRGFITNIETGENVEFQVNPATMERVINLDWTVIQSPGSSGPEYQYAGGGEREIKFDLTLDGIDRPIQEEGILKELSQLELFTYPRGQDALQNRMFLSPPRLILGYGPRQWEIVIEKLRITEKIHNRLLIPIFATVEVTAKVDLLYSEVNQALFNKTSKWASSDFNSKKGVK
jgi:hypothetical protein